MTYNTLTKTELSGRMNSMECNPHTLNVILERIRDQMRCPQCGTRIDVDFPSIKMAGDSFMLLQLKCESCTSFIVLHVNLTDQPEVSVVSDATKMMNASSSLSLSKDEMTTLRSALKEYEGSFEKMFTAVSPKKI